MKNKNGFVFVETIVVVSILATALIMMYASFTGLLTSEKTRLYYDDPIYLYRTYYILDFLQNYDLATYVQRQLSSKNESSEDRLLTEFSCSEVSVVNTPGGELFCESIINNKHFSVDHIYFTYYDTTPLTECTNGSDEITCTNHPSLETVSSNALRYIRSLGGKGKSGYRIIVEYKETINNENKYYYSSLLMPVGDMDRTENS